MQESPLFEYYYAAMQPGKHYVPFYVKGHPDDIVQVCAANFNSRVARAPVLSHPMLPWLLYLLLLHLGCDPSAGSQRQLGKECRSCWARVCAGAPDTARTPVLLEGGEWELR
jgi:hypothetical protein